MSDRKDTGGTKMESGWAGPDSASDQPTKLARLPKPPKPSRRHHA